MSVRRIDVAAHDSWCRAARNSDLTALFRRRRQIRTAPIKGQLAPATAKRRKTAIAILQIQQPFYSRPHCAKNPLIPLTKRVQGQERSGSIVGIRYPSG